MERCPNCGKEANFIVHGGWAHGGEKDERWFETWYVCDKCNARASEKEIAECNGT